MLPYPHIFIPVGSIIIDEFNKGGKTKRVNMWSA